MVPRLDSHQHFWRYDARRHGWIDGSMAAIRRDFLPADLEPLLRQQGIAGCIAVQAEQSLAETRFLLDLAARHAFVRGVIGWVDLRAPDVGEQLQTLAHEPALRGVRHIVQHEPDPRFLLQPDFVRGVAALAPHGLVYDLLVYPHQLPAAAELAAALPAQRFVLDHLGKPRIARSELEPWASDLRRLAKRPNVHCKLSGMVTEAHWQHWQPQQLHAYFAIALDAFGPDRLLFGSDWPVCLVASSYARWCETVDGWLALLPGPDRDAVLGGNTAAVYGLS